MARVKRATYTTEELVSALLYTYEVIVKKRRDIGDTWTALSRREYQENKRDHDPDYWTIERILGSWSAFTRLIPSSDFKRYHSWDQSTMDVFRDVLNEIAQSNKKKLHEVTIRDFIKYRQDHPDENIHDWRTYATIFEASSWTELRHLAITD